MLKWTSLLCVVAFAFVAACSDETGTDGMIAGEGILDGQVGDMPITDGAPPATEYKYVMIEDLSTVTGSGDGADIDAVELQKGGNSSWVEAAESCKLPDGSDCANSDQAVGNSDAFCTNVSECFSNVEVPTDDPATIPPYVALGGDDGTNKGTLIVRMTDKIENGDKLIVYELGNCQVSEACGTGTPVTASADSVKVSVGTAAGGPWTEVLAASDTTNHPRVEIDISGLP